MQANSTGEVNQSKQVTWVKPLTGKVKINTNGSSCGDPPKAGFGLFSGMMMEVEWRAFLGILA